PADVMCVEVVETVIERQLATLLVGRVRRRRECRLAGCELLHGRIGARKEETLVAVIGPAHDVLRRAGGTVHLQDLGVPIGIADVVALDDDSISDVRFHQTSRRSRWLGLTVRTGARARGNEAEGRNARAAAWRVSAWFDRRPLGGSPLGTEDPVGSRLARRIVDASPVPYTDQLPSRA